MVTLSHLMSLTNAHLHLSHWGEPDALLVGIHLTALVLSAFEKFSSFGRNSKVGHSALFAVASEPHGQLGMAAELAPQHVLSGDGKALFNSANQRCTGVVQL